MCDASLAQYELSLLAVKADMQKWCHYADCTASNRREQWSKGSYWKILLIYVARCVRQGRGFRNFGCSSKYIVLSILSLLDWENHVAKKL